MPPMQPADYQFAAKEWDYDDYGSAGVAEKDIFTPGSRRQRINILPIVANIFLPWFLFTAVYSIMSFSFHYHYPTLTWIIVLAAFGPALLTGYLTIDAKAHEREPMWYNFATLSFFLAVLLAVIFGDMNFHYNTAASYDEGLLNTYPNVNPATEKGGQMMDAGRVFFADGTHLDQQKAMAFKNADLYCVAPIVKGDTPMATYDFWAVGVNCCSGIGSDFRCGAFNDPKARAGLRLMRQDQRPFFRLAVQQAEAAYSLKANHPLFFQWMADPVKEFEHLRVQGFNNFLQGTFTFLAFQVFCVFCALVGFSKIGRY